MGIVRAFAPGRVNLIGDHTDYTGGWALPMAVEWGTTVEVRRGGPRVELVSDAEADPAVVGLDGIHLDGIHLDGSHLDGSHLDGSHLDGSHLDGSHLDGSSPGSVQPDWARYVAGVVAVVRPGEGAVGTVSTSLPVGAGLSSSAALEVSVALALGFEGPPLELALACQKAEHLAVGVPSGVMDQLASASGIDGHALLLDCTSLEVAPVAMPAGCDVVVVHSGQSRTLAGSAYAERRAQCEAAIAILGPLREASSSDLHKLEGVLQARARHVITENRRVLDFAGSLRAGDLADAGRLMTASHASLACDFEVSTPALDALVAELSAVPGVYGARLTGAGFGGCVVALADPGSPVRGWRLHASAGARIDVPSGSDTEPGVGER